MCRETQGGLCFNPEPCDAPPESFRYLVERSPVGQERWREAGYACLTDPPDTPPEVDLTLVLTQWRSLTWPAATMVIQPPDGETLVNLDTIFYTTSTQPVPQTVTLLGQTVEIEATPTSYTWHWTTGDDNATTADRTPHTTSDPGAAHPHATITHRYTTARTTVHPSVDITYQGRYRVNGGPWQTIPEPRTITGTPSPLTILEATPTLVH